MLITKVVFVAVAAGSIAFGPAAYGQTAQPGVAPPVVPAIATVRLDTVAIAAHARPLTLRAPGTARGLHDAFAYSITPTRQIAVWHPNPDSTHTYRIRAVRVRLGSRLPDSPADLLRARRIFGEGRLALRLSPATVGGSPAEANLLPAPLVLTPAGAGQHDHGWVRFDVSAHHLVLPATGVFVIATGLPTNEGDQFVRTRTLVRPLDGRHPPEDLTRANMRAKGKGTEVFQYEEVQPAGGGPTCLLPTNSFPAVAQRSTDAGEAAQSWRWHRFNKDSSRWFSSVEDNALLQKINPTKVPIYQYNYDLELEVEEY